MRTRRSTSALVAIATATLASACALVTLRRDLEQANALAVAEGRVNIRGNDTAPLVVVLYTAAPARVVDVYPLPRPGPFSFVVPAGTYRLAAFADRSRDLAYQPDLEPAAFHGDPNDVTLGAGERRSGLDIAIDPQASVRLPVTVPGLAPGGREGTELPHPQLGTVVDIDDPRFSHENGELGLWNPIEFLLHVGAGVYFLEDYDPNKVPVLFVHGATGHPAEWKFLISTLDRSRDQPWVAFYPSAPRIERLSRALLRAMGALQARFGFSRLVIVAHSMGGLVTRGAINASMADPTGRRVSLAALITISTPWNGHAAAAKGVERSPVVVPSWEDLAPGSAFLTRLPETPLPPECEHTLFFGYRGGSRILGETNDGAVAVSSELSLPIQRQASRIVGFDESHRSILRSAEVAREMNAILDRVAR